MTKVFYLNQYKQPVTHQDNGERCNTMPIPYKNRDSALAGACYVSAVAGTRRTCLIRVTVKRKSWIDATGLLDFNAKTIPAFDCIETEPTRFEHNPFVWAMLGLLAVVAALAWANLT